MPSVLRRIASVLLTTTIVGLGVYSAVQLGNRVFAQEIAVADSAGTRVTTAPSTTSTTAAAAKRSARSTTTTSPSGNASRSQAGNATQVCPRTGCTASSCHATDPSAPGGRR
jgi:hypothetical protein